MLRILKAILLLSVLFFTTSSFAETKDSRETQQAELQDLFYKEQRTFQLVSGAIFSPVAIASRSPVMDYAQTNLRFGRIITGIHHDGTIFRGNWEFIFEITNSVIYKGFGHYMGGLTAIFRYNFIQLDSKLYPYLQVGLGFVYNDAYKERTQNTIGQAIEFTPQASLGIHYLINPRWTFDMEAIFHHISNAGMSDRNRGLNAMGGFIGLTYLFH
jgi:hypothetical protein